MVESVAKIDLWGKGHRVTRTSEEFQRIAPPKRAEAPSFLQGSVDRFEHWPVLLDSLHKGAPRSLPEQYCVLVTEHEAAVAVPHATRDGHDRASILVVVAYVPIDWKVHVELVNRVCRARSLCVRLGAEFAKTVSGANQGVSDNLKKGTYLQDGGYDLGVERAGELAFWEELMGGVARYRGIRGVATPRMYTLGANVVIGTRAEAERAGADGFFDQRTRQLVSLGERLLTWQPEGSTAPAAAPRTPEPSDVVTHVLEMRDRLEHVEATVDRMASRLEAAATPEPSKTGTMNEIRQAVDSANRRVEAKIEAIDRRAQQHERESRSVGEQILEIVGAMYGYVRRLL
jgi:hypothetical protein